MSAATDPAHVRRADGAGCGGAGITHREFARAKINLTLRVLGRRADGYHELESLVVFADIGDRVSLVPGGTSALEVSGPFAAAIAGQNLIDQAVAAVKARWGEARVGRIELVKELPVAAGIGGGSADAAATLRLLRAANGDIGSDEDWHEIALSLGSDVPVCFLSRAAILRGRGEHVAPLTRFPALHAVIVNPRVPLSTAQVFAALKAPPLDDGYRSSPQPLPACQSLASLSKYMSENLNDLEPAARRLCPVIDAVLGALTMCKGVLASRMSGSGPTCFALFATAEDAAAAAARLTAAEPRWWVAAAAIS